jgi:hypothetical protein
MEGRLEVRSRPGETVFRLTLPRAGAAPHTPPAPRARAVSGTGAGA